MIIIELTKLHKRSFLPGARVYVSAITDCLKIQQSMGRTGHAVSAEVTDSMPAGVIFPGVPASQDKAV